MPVCVVDRYLIPVSNRFPAFTIGWCFNAFEEGVDGDWQRPTHSIRHCHSTKSHIQYTFFLPIPIPLLQTSFGSESFVEAWVELNHPGNISWFPLLVRMDSGGANETPAVVGGLFLC